MYLDNVYIMMDDTVPEQKHLELVFLFNDDKENLYEYAITFDTGMPLSEFKEFVKKLNSLIQNNSPAVCH